MIFLVNNFMINVLPTEEKQSIKKEYYFRLATVNLFFISLVVIIATGLLVPSYLYSTTKVNSLATNFAVLNQTNADISEDDLSKIITDINNTLVLLSNNNNKFDVSNNVLGTILSLRIDGIVFSSISYMERTDANRIVELQGVAKNREILSSFQDKLESDQNIAGVDLPISNFTKRTDIDFKVTIKMK